MTDPVTISRVPRGKGPTGRRARELKRERSDARAESRRQRATGAAWAKT